MAAKITMVGQRYGRLVVVAESEKHYCGNAFWDCKCDCGNICVVRGAYLRSGHTKSCGCYKAEKSAERMTTHGQRKTRLYRIWHGMKTRCYYENQANYKDYGGRGITVCEEWRNSFTAFYEWAMSNGYADGMQLDRMDNNGNYSPKNCKWSTTAEQANNKRNNTPIEIGGKTMNITQWAKASGVSQPTISARYKKGLRGADLIKPPDPICSAKAKKRRTIPKGD